MSDHSRFAIYYLAPEGPLADFGAAWLGWDIATGMPVSQPEVEGIDEITATPRKYGFHATLKPPFFLAEGGKLQNLEKAVEALAGRLVPVGCDELELAEMGGFLALTPRGNHRRINRLAAEIVERLDAFRRLPSAAEIARRREAGLTARQEAMLARWGYPYVKDEFRFHMTLTGNLGPERVSGVMQSMRPLLPPLPAPFTLDEIALVGERPDGRFELLHRYALSG